MKKETWKKLLALCLALAMVLSFAACGSEPAGNETFVGMELKVENMSFDGLLMSLAEGKFDMVLAGLTKAPDREVLFSDSYNSRNQAVIINAKDADKFKSADDLMGMKVAGQSGTVQQTLAEQYAGDTAAAIQLYPDMIMMLKEGTIDQLLADAQTLAAQQEKENAEEVQ